MNIFSDDPTSDGDSETLGGDISDNATVLNDKRLPYSQRLHRRDDYGEQYPLDRKSARSGFRPQIQYRVRSQSRQERQRRNAQDRTFLQDKRSPPQTPVNRSFLTLSLIVVAAFWLTSASPTWFDLSYLRPIGIVIISAFKWMAASPTSLSQTPASTLCRIPGVLYILDCNTPDDETFVCDSTYTILDGVEAIKNNLDTHAQILEHLSTYEQKMLVNDLPHLRSSHLIHRSQGISTALTSHESDTLVLLETIESVSYSSKYHFKQLRNRHSAFKKLDSVLSQIRIKTPSYHTQESFMADLEGWTNSTIKLYNLASSAVAEGQILQSETAEFARKVKSERHVKNNQDVVIGFASSPIQPSYLTSQIQGTDLSTAEKHLSKISKLLLELQNSSFNAATRMICIKHTYAEKIKKSNFERWENRDEVWNQISGDLEDVGRGARWLFEKRMEKAKLEKKAWLRDWNIFQNNGDIGEESVIEMLRRYGFLF